jgi:hypothetical protein
MRLSGSIGMAGRNASSLTIFWLEPLGGPQYVERERACFKETGIFPIMHVAAIKQEVVDRYPWVPATPAR